MSEDPVARVLAVLSAPESPLRAEGVRLLVDHVLAQKLKDVVDFERVGQIALDALAAEPLAAIVEQHVKPGWQRYEAAVEFSEARVGDLVSSQAQQALRAIAHGFRLPRAKWTKGSVDPTLLRRLFAPVWTQVLLSFGKRFSIPGLGAASGPATAAPSRSLASALGRAVQERAGRMVDAGRSVIEGLGLDVEKKLMAAARDFSEGALAVWNDALRERLASDEGRALVAQINVSVLDHVLRTRLGDLQKVASDLPIEAVLDVAPDLLSHALRAPFVQEIVQRELAAYLAIEGERSLQEHLVALGVAERVRTLLVDEGDVLLRSFGARPGVAEWLARLLRS